MSGSGAVRGAVPCSPSRDNSAKDNPFDINTKIPVDFDNEIAYSKRDLYSLLAKNEAEIITDGKRLKGEIEDGNPLIAVNEIEYNWSDIPNHERSPRLKDLNKHLNQMFSEMAEQPVDQWFSDISSQAEGHAMSRMINLLAKHYKLELNDGDFLQKLKEKCDFSGLVAKEFSQLLFGEVTFITTYEKLIEEWLGYLVRTENTTVLIGNLTGEQNLSFAASHRWDEKYAEKMMAKVKALEESRFNKMPVAVLRLSGYQDGITPDDFDKDRERSWLELNEDLDRGRKKLLNKLRKVAKRDLDGVKLHYFWVREPHPSSGYPHKHLVVFGEVAHWLRKKGNQDYIKNLWDKKWDIGNEHGLHFDCEIPQRSGKGALESVANYLLKYLVKSFGDVESKHDDKEILDMSYEEALFNSFMWASGSRSWSASKEVSEVMSKDDDTSESKGVYVFGGGSFDKNPENVSLDLIVESSGNQKLKETYRLRKEFKPKLEERYSEGKEWSELYPNSGNAATT